MTEDEASQRGGTDSPGESKRRRDERNHFDTSDLHDDLRGHTVRGGALTTLAQVSRQILKILSIIVLARILTPGDFGLIAMISAITGFLTAFRELGLASATVQREHVTHQQVSTLFWINALLGAAVAAMVAAMAPVIAWFFDDSRLLEVTWVVAGGFVFAGLGAQHRALLRRRMRYKALAGVRVISDVLANATAILMGLLGAGYWSLLAIPLGPMVFGAIGAWVVSGWTPGPPVRGSGVRSMLSFGAFLSGSRVLNHLARNLDNVLIGWQVGAAALGFYRNAYQLLLMPLRQLSPPLAQVAIPGLSRLQNQPRRYVRFYKQAVAPLAAISTPTIVFAIVAAHDLVRVVLGPGWDRAAEIFQMLGPAALTQAMAMATMWVFISLDRTNRQFRWMLVQSALLAVAFGVGVQWNAEGVAVAYSIASLALLPAQIVYCYRRTPLRPRDLVDAVWRPFAAAIAASITPALIMIMFPDLSPFVRLPFTAAAFGITYLGLWAGLPGGFKQMNEMLSLRRDLLGGRRARAAAAESG